MIRELIAQLNAVVQERSPWRTSRWTRDLRGSFPGNATLQFVAAAGIEGPALDGPSPPCATTRTPSSRRSPTTARRSMSFRSIQVVRACEPYLPFRNDNGDPGRRPRVSHEHRALPGYRAAPAIDPSCRARVPSRLTRRARGPARQAEKPPAPPLGRRRAALCRGSGRPAAGGPRLRRAPAAFSVVSVMSALRYASRIANRAFSTARSSVPSIRVGCVGLGPVGRRWSAILASGLVLRDAGPLVLT
jgi:hypothetical protein